MANKLSKMQKELSKLQERRMQLIRDQEQAHNDIEQIRHDTAQMVLYDIDIGDLLEVKKMAAIDNFTCTIKPSSLVYPTEEQERAALVDDLRDELSIVKHSLSLMLQRTITSRVLREREIDRYYRGKR